MITIGRLAKLAQVNVETIRFYERKGLIEQPPTPSTGYRQYDHKTLLKVQFVKRAQTLGFSLDEIKELIALESSCEGVQKLAEDKRSLVQQKITSLQGLETNLSRLIESCENNDQPSCPIIETLVSPTKLA